MNQITIPFANRTDMFYFIENIAHAQKQLADRAEQNGTSSEDLFSMKSLADLIRIAAGQLATEEMEREIKSIVEE